MKNLAVKRKKMCWLLTVLIICFLLLNFAYAMDGKTTSEIDPDNLSSFEQLAANKIDMAKVSAQNTNKILLPNNRGDYPRLSVLGSSKITASVFFFEAVQGEQIRIQAEDGGWLQDEAQAGFVTVDKYHRANFKFQVLTHDGLYRVTLRRGGERRVLQFWVGSESPVFERD